MSVIVNLPPENEAEKTWGGQHKLLLSNQRKRLPKAGGGRERVRAAEREGHGRDAINNIINGNGSVNSSERKDLDSEELPVII